MIQDKVTIQEACRTANISRQTLYRWIEKGLLSREKDGNRVYVSLAEVRALCNQVDKQDVTGGVTEGNAELQHDTGKVTADTKKVTLDLEYYNGLITRLAGLEIERRYLLENKSNLEQIRADAERNLAALKAKDRELAEIRAELERARLPWYKKLFRNK